MDVQIRAKPFSLTSGLQRAVLHHVDRTLAGYGTWIDTVMVRLSDVNGPRGGEDKHCRILVSLVPSGGVIAQATDCDMYVAIRKAADRAAAMVKRNRDRQATLRTTKPLTLDAYEPDDDTDSDLPAFAGVPDGMAVPQ